MTLKAYTATIRQNLSRAALQALIILENVVTTKAGELDEEWDLILGFVMHIANAKYLTTCKNLIEALQTFFQTMRNLYISEAYTGNKDKLMNVYLHVKDIIADTTFDILYMSYVLKGSDLMLIKETLEQYIKASVTAKGQGKELVQTTHSLQVSGILSGLEDLYDCVKIVEKKAIIEEVVVPKAIEWLSFAFTDDCKLKLIRLLKAFAFNTANNDTFKQIIKAIINAIYRGQSDNVKKNEVSQTRDVAIGKAAFRILFQLFYDSYLKFPPTRLMHVLDGFISSLQAGSNNTKSLTLQLLANITYDPNSYLYVSRWKVKSYLLGTKSFGDEQDESLFSPQKILSATSQFINPEVPQGLLVAAVDALASIVNAHYPLLFVDISKSLEKLATNLRGFLKELKYESLIRLIELSSLIILQRNPNKDTKGIYISSSSLLSFFSECLTQLSQIAVVLMKDINDLKKPAQKPSGTSNSQGDLFQAGSFQLLSIIVIELMKAISKIFYVSDSDLLPIIDKLIVTTKLYTTANVLAEKFVNVIQEVIVHLYYSGLMSKLSKKNLLGLMDICLQLGWRNIFCTEKQAVHSLQEHLEGKSLFSTKSGATQGSEASFSQTDRRTAIVVSQLTFPTGETGQKLLEEINTRLRIKVKEPSTTYCSYQNDSSHIMHTIMTNIIRLFLLIDTTTQPEVLDYLSRIMRQEIRNEQSMVLQQSILLMELLGWYSFSNIDRANFTPSIPVDTKGKLWIVDDSLIYVETEGKSATIKVRNLVSSTTYNLQLQTPMPTVPHKESLAALREGRKIIGSKEQEIKITPEHILNNFPSIALRVNEKNPGWDAVEVKEEIAKLIESLDSTPVHDTHSIGVVYIPEGCEFSEEGLYSVKSWSKRFEEFIEGLGCLVSVKENVGGYRYLGNIPINGSDGKYGILWQDKLMHIFFHVNVLMQYIDETTNNYRNLHGKIDPQEEAMVTQILSSVGAKSSEDSKGTPMKPSELKRLIVFKIRRHLQSDNVIIIWNESGKKEPLDTFKGGKTSIFIVITPFNTGCCEIKRMTVSFRERE